MPLYIYCISILYNDEIYTQLCNPMDPPEMQTSPMIRMQLMVLHNNAVVLTRNSLHDQSPMHMYYAMTKFRGGKQVDGT